jgi:hypothetical protein
MLSYTNNSSLWDCEFKVSLGYIGRLYLKKKTKQQQKRKHKNVNECTSLSTVEWYISKYTGTL